MSGVDVPPDWRLPHGVNASLWRYAHTPRLADEEDAYFVGHPLFETDARLIDARFEPPGRVVDLGCGTGRHALRLAARGFDVTAVELSPDMLRAVAAKALGSGLSVKTVRANLCGLGCFPDGSFDLALSMFSTLGMVRGVPARRRALAEAFRVLRPGGRLALHAHNLWLNLADPQGRRWLLGQLGLALLRRPGLGDRQMTYRGIPGMEVHLYRWRELRRELLAAGFEIDEVVPLHATTAREIPAPWLLPGWRAGGWVVFARRPGAV